MFQIWLWYWFCLYKKQKKLFLFKRSSQWAVTKQQQHCWTISMCSGGAKCNKKRRSGHRRFLYLKLAWCPCYCLCAKWCRPLYRCQRPLAGCCSLSGWIWFRCRLAALPPGWCAASAASCFDWPPLHCTPGKSSSGCSSHPSHWSPPTENDKERNVLSYSFNYISTLA